jgi:hypothetical protein
LLLRCKLINYSSGFFCNCLNLGVVLVLAGCQGGQGTRQIDTAQEAKAKTGTSGLEFTEDMKSRAVDMGRQVKKAIMDLADRLNVPPNEIKVVRAESVTWHDGSLGCPEKGMSYTQALVPGTRIVLRAGDAEHEYHSGSDGAPFYCANPQLPAPALTAE